jgi:predicted glutamine amidotransferase
MLEITILKIWIIGILISSIIHLATKKKSTVLSCGLFGFNGNPGTLNATLSRIINSKIRVLGLYNIDRGKHSCGLYIDDTIHKGVNEEKLFSDFIAKFTLPNASQSGNYNVIGHTRAATVGSHSADNAHPFMINDNFVLAHNGVIKNITQLCNKYSINGKDYTVDSHGLAHLINKEGFKVLNQYEGFAALLMAHRDRPNEMKVYRGASKRTQNGELEEERPLFYMTTEEGIYFSSIEKSLYAISDSDDDRIGEVPHNTVFTVQDGRLRGNRFNVDRGSNNVTYVYTNPNAGGTTRNTGKTSSTTTHTMVGGAGTNCSVGNSYPAGGSDLNKMIPAIWHETLPARISKYKFCKGVIFHFGRFWLVDNDEITPAHGAYYITKKGKVETEHQTPNHWFIEGVMMRTKGDYHMAKIDPNIANPNWNFARYISKYSMYPVCNTRTDVNTKCRETHNYAKYRWFMNESMCGNFGFTPKFSDRHYVLKDGLTDKVAMAKHSRAETELCIDGIALAKEQAALNNPSNVMHIVKETGTGEVETNVLNTMAQIKLALAERAVVEQELPFDDIKDKHTEQALLNLDPSHFYMPFSSIDEAEQLFTKEEKRAIRYYLADVMAANGIYTVNNVYEDIIDTQLSIFFQMCIDNDTTVMDQWNEKDYHDIITYLLIAKGNEDGDIYDDYDLEDVGSITVEEDDCCSYTPPTANIRMKPGLHEDQDNSVPEGWVCTEEGILLNKDDMEPPFIETIVKQEIIKSQEAGVPAETFRPVADISDALDDLEQEDPNQEEITHHFEEAMTMLLSAREEADQLQKFDDSDFAQHVAQSIYVNVDSTMNRLLELCETHDQKELADELLVNVKLRAKS